MGNAYIAALQKSPTYNSLSLTNTVETAVQINNTNTDILSLVNKLKRNQTQHFASPPSH